MSGCCCRRCDAGQPHAPVDETLIARALKNDPSVFGPVKRRLSFYDSKPARSKPASGGMTRQPWEPRPSRRAA
jgi:hypothetical protein